MFSFWYFSIFDTFFVQVLLMEFFRIILIVEWYKPILTIYIVFFLCFCPFPKIAETKTLAITPAMFEIFSFRGKTKSLCFSVILTKHWTWKNLFHGLLRKWCFKDGLWHKMKGWTCKSTFIFLKAGGKLWAFLLVFGDKKAKYLILDYKWKSKVVRITLPSV